MPTLVTPNDSTTLRELCTKTQAAIESLDHQIAALRAQVEAARSHLQKREDDLRESEQKGSQLESHLQELHARFKQAQTSANIAAGTPAEVSTAAYVSQLSTEIEAKQQALEEHRKHQASQTTSARKEQYTIQQQIDADEAELKTLRENRQRLTQTYKENHAALGETLYREIEQTMADFDETVETLTSNLRDARSERETYRDRVPQLLSEWPALAKQTAHTQAASLPPEPPSTVVLIETQLKYLQALSARARDVETTSHINKVHAINLLAVPPRLVEIAMQSQPTDALERWQSELREYKRQIEQEQQERNRRRSQGGW